MPEYGNGKQKPQEYAQQMLLHIAYQISYQKLKACICLGKKRQYNQKHRDSKPKSQQNSKTAFPDCSVFFIVCLLLLLISQKHTNLADTISKGHPEKSIPAVKSKPL